MVQVGGRGVGGGAGQPTVLVACAVVEEVVLEVAASHRYPGVVSEVPVGVVLDGCMVPRRRQLGAQNSGNLKGSININDDDDEQREREMERDS